MTVTLRPLPPDLHLAKGAHENPGHGMCLLEAAAYIAREPHSDHPVYVSRVLGAYGRALNDALPDDKRQALVPLTSLLVGTAGDGQDEARGWLAVDWLTRTYTPAFLHLVPALAGHADNLAALPPVSDTQGLAVAQPLLAAARAAAWDAARAAARAAAWDAARAAAWDAAGAAAGDAAWDAARAAAWAAARAAAGAAAGAAARAAAWDAAGAAARAAAWDAAKAAAWDAAAWDALAPTAALLQDSAIDLFRRMIDPAAVTA